MNIRFQTMACIVVAASLLSAATAYGQRGGGPGRRENFDPADILKRMDENNNGIIETSEISNRSRSFVERAAERAKLDVSKPMPIDKLLPAMQANFEEFRQQQGGGRGPGGSTSSSTPSGSSPRPGFGSGPRPVGGFAAPAAAPVAVSSGLGAPSSRAGSIISLEARFDQSVIEYVNGDLLKRLDKNGDGSLDSVEWKANTWSKPPEESDLNKDGKLSREELCIRISKSRGIPIKGETATSSSGGSSPTLASSGRSSSGGSNAQYRAYAEGLLRNFDKNKDGSLQSDEWKEMKTEHQGADSNRDGTITVDELTTRIAAYSSGGASSSPLSSGRSYKGSADKTAATAKKSYRFLTPTERLPKGMPDWFIKNDADGDGQIMMSEYAASYTESIAAEFAKYDVDGDGIITPNECLAGPKK